MTIRTALKKLRKSQPESEWISTKGAIYYRPFCNPKRYNKARNIGGWLLWGTLLRADQELS